MRLGKRPATRLRIELTTTTDGASAPTAVASPDPAAPEPPSVQSFKRLRNASPPAPIAPQHGAGAPHTTGRAAESGSNFTRSGCLSPTDSAPLLAKSLALAAERTKALSESEEAPAPPANALTDEKDRIGDFVLLSKLDAAGLSFHALHTPTQKLHTCQVLSKVQVAHLLRVRQRLNTVAAELADVAAAILPSNTQLVSSNGRHFLFSPQTFGSLHSYVQSRKKLSEDATRALFGQIVAMVAAAHSVGIVVRDLKLRQFVFADAGQTRLRMGRTSDVVVLAEPGRDELSDRHGCPAYVSPEILDLAQPTHSGKAADMWSLGVLLFVMLLGRYPFYDQTPNGLFGKIRDGNFAISKDEGLSLEVLLLLRGLLRRVAAERPTAQLLAAVPWLQTRPASLPAHRLPHSPPHGLRPAPCDDQVVPSM